MAGLINWRKVAPPIGSPDTAHVYVGVDIDDCKLYLKDDTGAVFKYETSGDVAVTIAAALADYDLSTIVDSKISTAINNLINGAGAALDTLNELADALGNDPNFATTVTSALALKANTADLGDLALLDTVGAAQIQNSSVLNSKIVNNAVSVAKIANNAVQNSKLADMPTLTIKGNDTGATADPKDLTVLETKTMLALENIDNTSDANKPISASTQTALNLKYDASNPNGYETPAQLNTRDTNNRSRANHTGAQLASTISDFATTVISTALVGLSSATSQAIAATDTILQAFGYLQGQINTLFNRTISSGYGLAGGGNLTADRSFAVSLATSTVEATATTTTTSGADLLMNLMTITPAAGTYLVFFGTSVESSADDADVFISVYSGGIGVLGSGRSATPNVSAGFSNPLGARIPISTHAVVTVDGSQAIEGRWRRTSGTASAFERSLIILRTA